MPDNKRRVVITGYGTVSPLGMDSAETFEGAAQGKSGIDYLKNFDTTGLPCQIGGEVDDSRLAAMEEALPGTKVDRYLSRGARFARLAVLEAVLQARLAAVTDRNRIGFALGSHGDNASVGEIALLHRYYDGEGRWDVPGLLKAGGYPYKNFFLRKSDVATSALSMLFDFAGPNLSIVSACSAGPQAIGESYYMIKEGRTDVMVAGGCESTLNFVGFIGFVLITALSEKYDTPQSASRPFDRKRNAFVMSEGAGVVVLEELEHARKRGAPILGELLGYASSADAYRITDTHPKGLGAIYAMRDAIKDAGLSPDDIDYISAHGTSTQQNDLGETKAIKEVFGERAKDVPVSSVKSMLGHTIAAAGAIECILALMGINHSIILPTINYENRDPRCDLDYVPNEAREVEHRVALSNSFGFGGQNACLVVGKYDE
jgi:3-oxoacyl-[acyl-carrier-protein] synthase II